MRLTITRSIWGNRKERLIADHPDFYQVRPNLLIACRFLRKDWYKAAISARVLYSDGTIKEMSEEDADELIFQQAFPLKHPHRIVRYLPGKVDILLFF